MSQLWGEGCKKDFFLSFFKTNFRLLIQFIPTNLKKFPKNCKTQKIVKKFKKFKKFSKNCKKIQKITILGLEPLSKV